MASIHEQENNLFTKIGEGTCSKPILARVERTWYGTNNTSGHVYSLEMVLIDSAGNQMHGQINLKDIPYFKDKVKDQQLIRIKGFVVKSYHGGFRPIPGTRKLYVNSFTSIVLVQEDGQQIPRYKFALAEFASLREKLGQRTDLIDVVGVLRGLSASELKRKKNETDVVARDILLENLTGLSIRVTLWKNLACEFDDSMLQNGNTNPIVVVTSTTAEVFQGEIFLQSSKATRVYIDLDIPEMEEFKKMEYVPIKRLGDTEVANQRKVDLLFADRLMLREASELLQNKEKNLGATFAIEGKIIGIKPGSNWYYMACPKCKRKHAYMDDKPWCNECTTFIITPMPRYKLQLVVHDGKTSEVITAIGDAAETILGGVKITNMIALPTVDVKLNQAESVQEITRTMGNTMVFGCRLDDSNFMYSSLTAHCVSKFNPIPREAHLQDAIKELGGANKDQIVDPCRSSGEERENDHNSGKMPAITTEQLQTPSKMDLKRKRKYYSTINDIENDNDEDDSIS